MRKEKLSQREMAKEIGITAYHFNAVIKKRVQASVTLALKIEEISKGQYKATDLRPDIAAFIKKAKKACNE